MADLEQDVVALRKAWSREPAKVERAKAQLAERGQLTPVRLRASDFDIASDGCVTIAVLGAVSTQFVMRFLPTRQGPQFPEGEHPEQSAAGAAQLVRCGLRKAMLSRLVIEMRSPRGVLEVLTARANRPVGALSKVLPSREPGPSAPFGRVGPRPNAAPVATRSRGFQLRSERRGARNVRRSRMRLGRAGVGDARVHLAPGCHEFGVMAGDPLPGGVPSDVDAELWRIPGSGLIAADRTSAADATLTACLGQQSTARLRVRSSPGASKTTVMHAHWALPDGIRAAWGVTARGRMAETLGVNELRLAAAPPVDEALLVSGVTLLPVRVSPGRCYLAAVAAVRGRPIGIAMATRTASGRAQNQSTPGAKGTTLAFCARNDRQLIEVEARGNRTSFLFALWAAGRVVLGAD